MKNRKQNERLLTLKEVCEILGICEETFTRVLRRKLRFPVVKIGLRKVGVVPSDLRRWLKNHTKTGPASIGPDRNKGRHQ